jgi:hypothetical protein
MKKFGISLLVFLTAFAFYIIMETIVLPGGNLSIFNIICIGAAFSLSITGIFHRQLTKREKH